MKNLALLMLLAMIMISCSDDDGNTEPTEEGVYQQKLIKYNYNDVDEEWELDESPIKYTLKMNTNIDYAKASYCNLFGKNFPMEYHFQYSKWAVEKMFASDGRVLLDNVFEDGYLAKTMMANGSDNYEIKYTQADGKLTKSEYVNNTGGYSYYDTYSYDGDYIDTVFRKSYSDQILRYIIYTRDNRNLVNRIDYQDYNHGMLAYKEIEYNADMLPARTSYVVGGDTELEVFAFNSNNRLISVSNGLSFPHDITTTIDYYGNGLCEEMIVLRKQALLTKTELDLTEY
jgi:hypothetical protein